MSKARPLRGTKPRDTSTTSRRTTRPRSSLVLLHFEHKPEDQAEINGIVLNNAEHTATQADV